MTGLLKVFAYLCVGEIIVRLTSLPVPGPMVGLLLMLVDLSIHRQADREVEQIFDGVSKHLAILFVPAGAGVIAYGTILSSGLSTIVVAVLLGTVTTMLVTACCFSVLHGNRTTDPSNSQEAASVSDHRDPTLE